MSAKTIWWLVIITFGRYEAVDGTKKRVCIIGTGVAGIAALRQVAMHPKDLEPIVFEKKSGEGGLWIYTEQSTGYDEFEMPIRSNVYTYLRTNGPKDLMVYPDFVNFRGENRSYVTHWDMLRYLQNYTANFDLRRYIQFNILVERVAAVSGIPDTQWKIRTRNLKTNEFAETICHTVLVCNGHYSKPRIPDIPGLESFPGLILHSISYRKPEHFTGQTVVVMGSGSSGTDIGLQITWFAKKVYLSHRHKLGAEIPTNMEEVAAVVSVDGNELTLSDGRFIFADAFVLCTGYDYDFPFLGKDSGLEIIEGKYVRPLYKHLVNIEHTTMAFVGLQFPSIPFPIAYVQAQYFTSVLLGKTTLPNREEMLQEAQLPPGVPVSKAHYMGPESVAYYDNLARIANFELLSDKHLARVFTHWSVDKKDDLMDFKDKNVMIFEDGHIEMHRQYYSVFGRDYGTETLSIY